MNILVYVGIIWIQMQYMIMLSNADNNFLDTLVFLAWSNVKRRICTWENVLWDQNKEERQKESVRAAAFYFIWGDKVMTRLHIYTPTYII